MTFPRRPALWHVTTCNQLPSGCAPNGRLYVSTKLQDVTSQNTVNYKGFCSVFRDLFLESCGRGSEVKTVNNGPYVNLMSTKVNSLRTYAVAGSGV